MLLGSYHMPPGIILGKMPHPPSPRQEDRTEQIFSTYLGGCYKRYKGLPNLLLMNKFAPYPLFTSVADFSQFEFSEEPTSSEFKNDSL
jgi:hypothetical protein